MNSGIGYLRSGEARTAVEIEVGTLSSWNVELRWRCFNRFLGLQTSVRFFTLDDGSNAAPAIIRACGDSWQARANDLAESVPIASLHLAPNDHEGTRGTSDMVWGIHCGKRDYSGHVVMRAGERCEGNRQGWFARRNRQ